MKTVPPSRRSIDGTTPSVVRTILRAPFTAETWRRTAYGIVSLPLAVVYFALTVPALIASAPLIIVFGLGLVLALVFFWVSRQFARFERARVRWMLGAHVPAPPAAAVTGNPAHRWLARCRMGSTWRTASYMLTNLPLSLITFFLCFYPWLQTIYSLSYPFVQWNTTFTEQAWGGPSWFGAVAVHTLPGIPMLFAAPWIVRVATIGHSAWVRLLLGRPRGRNPRTAVDVVTPGS